MTSDIPISLQDRLKLKILDRALGAASGHTMRIDDVPSFLIEKFVEAVRSKSDDVYIFELNEREPNSHLTINSDKAVELRNSIPTEGHVDHNKKLLLLVPPGNNISNPELSATGSSTGNSFEQLHLSALIYEIATELENDLASKGLGAFLRAITSNFPSIQREQSWASFLAEVSLYGSESFGEHLWLIGLVPDVGDVPLSRLANNIAAVKSISYTARPGLTVTERMAQAGIRVDSTSSELVGFLSAQRRLESPGEWCQLIIDQFRHILTFEKWPLRLQVASEIESVTISPFRKPDGSLDRSCKLHLTENDELVCKVDPESGGKLVIKWKTVPAVTDAVEKWHLEVVYPSDLRNDDSSPIARHSVKGSNRSASLTIYVNDDDLQQGTKFVVRLSATDSDGQALSLSSGELIDFESDEFDVVLSEEISEQDIRKANAATLPEAVLRAVEEGLDEVAHDLGHWDPKTQIFSIKLSPRRQTQILLTRISALLQNKIQSADPGRGKSYEATSSSMSEINIDDIKEFSFEIPDALSKRRRELLNILKAQSPRNYIEVADWNEELSLAASEYISAYRRAIDSCEEPEQRKLLLQIDSVTINASHSGETFSASLLLPIHPIRIAWFKTHSELLGGWTHQLLSLPKSKRKNAIDLDLMSRITPANLPFAILDSNEVPSIYFDELSIGTAVYFPVGLTDLEMKFRVILESLGLDRGIISGATTARQISDRIRAYSDNHDAHNSLSMIAVNPGEGRMLSSVLRQRSMTTVGDDLKWSGHVKVIAYSESASFAKPVSDLQRLQVEIKSARTDDAAIPFVPQLGLSSRDLEDLLIDDEPVHIALIHGLISNVLSAMPERIDRASTLRGLISPMAVSISAVDGEATIFSYPAVLVRGSQSSDEITSSHKAQLSALGTHIDVGNSFGISSHIDPNALALLGTVHSRADWVISVDRYLGASLYDLNFVTPEGRPFLLDYAPDFIDGIGDRITVTTSKRKEVDRLLKRALEDMGLYGKNHEPEEVLDALARLSGRLALRLTSNSTQAIEAVGLAVLMMHLEERGELVDTIVIPLDSHPEIFGQGLQDARTRALRCDIMLVRLTGRSFKIELVEVKNRKGAVIPRILSDHIGEQLRQTEKVVYQRYFESNEVRLDSELQWSKFTSMLHFYADRAHALGQASAEKLAELHRIIDRLEETKQSPEISKRGYVISLMGKQGFPEFSGDVPIAVLTQRELGQIGMTTLIDAHAHERSAVEESFSIIINDSQPTGEAVEISDIPNLDTDKAQQVSSSQDLSTSNLDILDIELENLVVTEKQMVETGTPPDSENAAEDKDSLVSDSFDPPKSPTSVLIQLGHDSGSKIATWKISTEGSPHAFILGIPGQGKSVTTRRIMRDMAEQNLPALVFDFHGDMAANPPVGMKVFDATQGLPFSPFEILEGKTYTHAAYEIREILAIVGNLGEIQGNTVYRALLKSYEACGFTRDSAGERLPTINEFVTHLEVEEIASKSKNARARLTPLTDFGLFDEAATETFDICSGKGLVVDLSGLGIEAVQMAAGSFILRKIYKEMFTWEQNQTMKLAIVLDEAHRLAKDVTLPKIMKEGRKYGVSVIVASQGLEDFNQAVISNAGTKIAFRCNFPSSRKVGGIMRGPKNVELSENIENLQVGQAYVSTPEHTEARKIYMFGDDE